MAAAKEWLVKYGYILCPDGRYRRPGRFTQVWQETTGGWLRYDPDGHGGEVPEVHSVAPEYQGVSGLSKEQHPNTFIWVYPEAEVEKIYRDACEAAEEAERLFQEAVAANAPALEAAAEAAVAEEEAAIAEALAQPARLKWWNR